MTASPATMRAWGRARRWKGVKVERSASRPEKPDGDPGGNRSVPARRSLYGWLPTSGIGRSLARIGSRSRPLVLVTEAPDGHDPFGVRRIGFDLGSQPLDVHVEAFSCRPRSPIPTPDRSASPGAAPAGVREQQVQQLELLERQRRLVTTNDDAVLIGIERHHRSRRRCRRARSLVPPACAAARRACERRVRASDTASSRSRRHPLRGRPPCRSRRPWP